MEEALKYEEFLQGDSLRVKERALFPPDCNELELQSLWFSGVLGQSFQSTCGKPVEIVQFGHWNHSAGPDFSSAAIEIDGERLKGAIELDTDVRDWEHHGHSTNPAYDGVVLHVFFTAPDDAAAFTRTSKHQNVLQIRLDPGTLSDLWGLPRFEADAHLGRCARPLEDMPGDRIESLLQAAAQHRLRQKGLRLLRQVAVHGLDQTIYQGIAEAFGYRPNKLALTVLAQRLRLQTLLSMPALQREACLLGAAGFLETAAYDKAPPETREYLQSLWTTWWKLRSDFAPAPDRSLHWNLSGVRPGNHPQRRIGALSVIVSRWDRLMRLFRDAPSFSEDQFRTFFQKLDHVYWSRHYTLKAGASDKALALVGATRVSDLLANQVYPLLIQSAPEQWAQFSRLPARLDNVRLRRAMARLFGKHPHQADFARKVYQQQALLQIYQDFCLEDDSGCEDCPFPVQLRQWR
jgi:hypothetical protein